ncbi:hypothetical protein MN608_05515 [Microdochium nivale]|nr:hypothetical protein MN608_05515 [Microdochium nivale]
MLTTVGNPAPAMMRYASPNELRTISREDLGWYNNVVLGAIYTLNHGGDTGDLLSPSHYYGAVRRIVVKHPLLTVVVKDKHTDKAYYAPVPSLDLAKHITVLGNECNSSAKGDTDTARIEKLLPSLADYAHPAERPPWNITILPLSEKGSSNTRLFIAFAFSHMLGDGMNGLTFHEDLLAGLRSAVGSRQECDAPSLIAIAPTMVLDEPFDTPKRLPISWGFLLGPLFAALLPKWLAILLGVRASTSRLKQGTWIGPPMFHNKPEYSGSTRSLTTPSSPSSSLHKRKDSLASTDKPTDETQLRLIEIPAEQVATALRASRQHGTKLTSVLHQIIVRALSAALPIHTNGTTARKANKDSSGAAIAITKFVSQTAINMRPTLNIPNTTMGLFVNGCFGYHDRTTTRDDGVRSRQQPDSSSSSPLSEAEWAAAAAMTAELSLCAARLADQPVGLLRYAPSVRGWMAKKMGQRRDCSYEVSNLLAFTPPPPPPAASNGEPGDRGARLGVDWVVFAQPRNPTSAPIVFDVVSIRGGNLVITTVWQAGALADVTSGVADEARLVDEICQGIREDFARFV